MQLEHPLHREAEEALNSILECLKHSRSAQSAIRRMICILSGIDPKVILYLGAGVSKTVHVETNPGAPSYRPSNWDELLQKVFEELDDRQEFLRSHRLEVDRRTGRLQTERRPDLDRLGLAWYLTMAFPSGAERDKCISKLVEPATTHVRESALIDALLHLPFRDIVTTNYDTNIAKILGKNYQGDKNVVQIAHKDDLGRWIQRSQKTVGVFHLHGQAGEHKAPFVFDRFDYSRFMAERGGLLDFVANLLEASHVICVGFGMNDPTFSWIEARVNLQFGSHRPEWFAFVPTITDKERDFWAQRRVSVIDYGEDHSLLACIIEKITAVLHYAQKAEPPHEAADHPNADRTSDYMKKAMQTYSNGDYAASHEMARAALASTLLWVPTKDGVLDDGRAAQVCEIRQRLALTHYKMQESGTFHENEHHLRMLAENISAATTLVKRHGTGANSRSIQWRALRNQLKLLQAREHYHDFSWEKALKNYSAVASQEVWSLIKNAKPAKWRWLLASNFYYGQCQMKRVYYQLGPDLETRKTAIEDLARLQEEIAAVKSSLFEPGLAGEDEVEASFFRQDLESIRWIARWMEGRYRARVTQDILPTEKECSLENYQELTKAIDRLSGEPAERKMPSPRWWADRHRYLCRAYCLRWLIGQVLGMVDGDGMLLAAYRQMQEAFGIPRGVGYERQRVVNLLEAARMNVIALYGFRKLNRRGPEAGDAPLTLDAGLYYLSEAFHNIEARQQALRRAHKKARPTWLEILAYRLASYYILVAGRERCLAILKKERSKRAAALVAVIKGGLDHLNKDLLKKFKQFETIAGQKMKSRMSAHHNVQEAVSAELSGTPTPAQARPNRQWQRRKRG